jgi:catechol 2,3-dioxygenase-like lactoylglutathione lyase family enzyme
MTGQEFIIEAIDHLSLSVTNLERSAKFYQEILGFDLIQVPLDYSDELNAGSYYFSVGNVEITLLKHKKTKESDRFSEFRVGLDHLSFRVNSENELEKLVRQLDNKGIKNQGIQIYKPNGKKYVIVRDPDNIQLEFWLDTPII